MQIEFYRPQTELLPTFSLVLAVSLAGLNPLTRAALNPINEVPGSIQPPAAHYAHVYYGRPEELTDQAAQMEAIRRFAEGLLNETEDTPQAVVEILNRHFWELL
ncbi:MAG: hypothetical protein HYY24_13075 [Verrucomicrobia bacterium]|nr:hypothetical protein [Verrucomicrobiota bacterium]